MPNTVRHAVRWRMQNGKRNNLWISMTRSAYYEDLKHLARQKRDEFCVNTAAFGLSNVRAIYKQEGIRIDHWPLISLL